MSEVTIKEMHAIVDAYGVRRNAEIREADRDAIRTVGKALKASKNGTEDHYRLAIMALVLATSTRVGLCSDRTMAGRRRYLASAKPSAFTIDLTRLFSATVRAQGKWQEGAAIAALLNRTASTVGIDRDRMLTVRTEPESMIFWVIVASE